MEVKGLACKYEVKSLTFEMLTSGRNSGFKFSQLEMSQYHSLDLRVY